MLLVSSFLVLFLSMVIAFLANHIDLKDRDPFNFLFRHNNSFLATSSNIGSVLSISTVVCGYLAAVSGWGLTPIFLLYFGIPIAYASFAVSAKRVRRNIELPESASERVTNTILDLIPNDIIRHRYRKALKVLYFSVIILELTVARNLLNELFPGSELYSIFIVLFISILCATYTSLGGFIGVLRTDLFQLIVFEIGCILVIANSMEKIKYALNVTFHRELFMVGDPLIFFGILFFIIAYNFSWPDLWIRNVSSLDHSSKFNIKPLAYGGVGIIIAVIPLSLLGLHIFVINKGPTHSMDAIVVMRSIASIIATKEFIEHHSFALWWLLGGGMCLFITSIDTWLIGIMQHSKLKDKHASSEQFKLYPYWIVLPAFLLSILVNNALYYSIGVVVTLVLFSNAMIIFMATFPVKNLARVNRFIEFYFVFTGALTFAGIVYFFNQMDKVLYLFPVFQCVSAFVIIFVLPKVLILYKKGETIE